MEIKNTRDMINKRNYLLTRLHIENEKLEKLSTSPFVNRKEKNIIHRNISDYKYGLEEIEEIMVEGSKFKSSDFAEFLEIFLSLTEKDYKMTCIKVIDDVLSERAYNKIKVTGDRSKLDNIPGKWCYFISDEETKEFILTNIIDEYDLEDFEESEASNDTIILKDFNIYPFKIDFKMKEDFAKHKRLKTAIYELIDLKIKNPDLSDQERLQIVLNNTIRRNLNRGYSYQKKKKSS